MTLVCRAFLISLHSCRCLFSTPLLLPLFCPSSFSLSLPSLSLSGCPLADKSLRSLMAANTPELKYVCSTSSLPFHCHFKCTATDTVQRHNAFFCWRSLIFCCWLLPRLLHLSRCYSVSGLGYACFSLQSAHVNVKWDCSSVLYVRL